MNLVDGIFIVFSLLCTIYIYRMYFLIIDKIIIRVACLIALLMFLIGGILLTDKSFPKDFSIYICILIIYSVLIVFLHIVRKIEREEMEKNKKKYIR